MKYAVLLALLAPASMACAADGLVTGPTVLSLLEQAGYSAALDEDGVDDPLILTAAAGQRVAAVPYRSGAGRWRDCGHGQRLQPRLPLRAQVPG